MAVLLIFFRDSGAVDLYGTAGSTPVFKGGRPDPGYPVPRHDLRFGGLHYIAWQRDQPAC